jgi:hypothetical protein
MNATPMLMDSADLARVPKLPGEMTEEMTMNIIPNYLRACHLQNIIDQAPKAHTANQARELLERLPRVPDDFEPCNGAIMPAYELDKSEV